MIAPFTIVDCRSHTLFEPYTFDDAVEANKTWQSMCSNTIERHQTRVLIMYKDAQMVEVFSHTPIGE